MSAHEIGQGRHTATIRHMKMVMPAIIANSSPATWGMEPLPALDMLSRPGLALAYAIRSGTVFAGNDAIPRAQVSAD